ncbi:MAG TPA: molybdopterin-guanine dinucleotide biosynthesis protein B [bacterium]|nr:molybdopterin-guanine dinucleotide biosynthesis protein B [bacterium]
MMDLNDLPILGIGGWSGAGKTSLIEGVLPRLRKEGLRVLVCKHCQHGFEIDREGKDSDRLFQAGGDVLVQDEEQECLRAHIVPEQAIVSILPFLSRRYDLILVEGHKDIPLPVVWLEHPKKKDPPPKTVEILESLGVKENREEALSAWLADWLPRQWQRTPVFGCVLIGGESRRMGRPKHLIESEGLTWLERTARALKRICSRVVIAGAGEIPPRMINPTQLPDVLGVDGPLAGVLAAMRWSPHASWVVAACDMPQLSFPALDWLISNRQPGVWAVLPQGGEPREVEPLLAYYDCRSHAVLESQLELGNHSLAAIQKHAKTATPEIPPHLRDAWVNANQPEEIQR